MSVIYLVYYLWWRITATLNPAAPLFSWVLVLAEAFGMVGHFLFSWTTRDISPTRPHVPPKPGLAVDAFIPAYNESLDILEATVIGCKRITYPHKTYLLDDGHRESVKPLALRSGCLYLARPTHEHAKAGNIDYALGRTEGEFVVVLDADMVPQPGFLDRTLGYFSDEQLAFIQRPQEFFNRDSIQHDQRAFEWHERSLFFRVIQPGKNHSNSAIWCGSPSVVRRKALEDVGGVATETITEDIHASVRLHSRGWSSLFVNEPLAYGIAPQTMQSFLLRRLRWARGTMQLYRGSQSPLWIPGLSLSQRVSYLSSFLAYFESFQKLVLILTPVFIIVLNVFPMRVGIVAFLARWVPYFGITVLANSLGGRGNFRYLQTEKLNLLEMVVFIQSTPILFQGKPLKFEVTPKSVDESVHEKERRSLRLHFLLLGLSAGVILVGLINLLTWSGRTLGREVYLIALAWAAYNAMVILIAITGVLRKRHERKQYRFRLSMYGELFDDVSLAPIAHVYVRDLSSTGVGFVTPGKMPSAANDLRLRFYTPEHKRVVLPLSNIHHPVLISGEKSRVGASFSDLGSIDRERLIEFLFVSIPGKRLASIVESRQERVAPASQTAPLSQASRLLTIGRDTASD